MGAPGLDFQTWETTNSTARPLLRLTRSYPPGGLHNIGLQARMMSVAKPLSGRCELENQPKPPIFTPPYPTP